MPVNPPTITSFGTTGGLKKFTMTSVSGVNGTQILNQPGELVAAQLGNINAAAAYCKLYDVANVTSAIAGNCDLNFIIPGNANGGGSNIGGPAAMPIIGAQFDRGIWMQLSSGIAQATLSGVQAGEVVVNFWFR